MSRLPRTADLVKEFLASRNGRTKKTVRWYEGMLMVFAAVNPRLPVRPGPIDQFLASVNRSEHTKHGYFRALRAFYRFLGRRHYVKSGERNPMADVWVKPPRRTVPYNLEASEVGYLLAAPLSRRDRALVDLLLDTGIRIGEALGLCRGDILEASLLVSGKTGQREVPVSVVVRQQLLDQARAAGTGPIFQGTKGPLTESGAYRIIRMALAAAGISGGKKHGPHVLRHTFGRQYIAAGGDLVSLQRIMGHRDIQTTRIYAELDLRDITHQHGRFSPFLVGKKALRDGLRLQGEFSLS